MAQHGASVRPGERADRSGRDDRRQHQADWRGNHEPGVRFGEERPRRGQRVEPEEAGAQQEGERHEEDPGVGMTACRLVGQVGERDAHRRCAEDQPEVARVVLPEEVELGTAQEQPQPDEGEQQRDGD